MYVICCSFFWKTHDAVQVFRLVDSLRMLESPVNFQDEPVSSDWKIKSGGMLDGWEYYCRLSDFVYHLLACMMSIWWIPCTESLLWVTLFESELQLWTCVIWSAASEWFVDTCDELRRFHGSLDRT